MPDAKAHTTPPAEPSQSDDATERGYHGESAADRGNPARPQDVAPFGATPGR